MVPSYSQISICTRWTVTIQVFRLPLFARAVGLCRVLLLSRVLLSRVLLR